MSWQEKLNNLPITQSGKREAQEPIATEIVLEFMREEVYPRLKVAQTSFFESGLEATVSPEFTEKISSDTTSVCLSVKRRMHGSEVRYSILFQRQEGFEICITLDRRNGPQNSVTFILDRKPESPTIFIELYLKDFREQFS